MRRALLAAPLLVLSLSACSDDPNSIAAQAKSGNRQGYISGDGSVETIPAAKRKKPVALTGTTLDDKQWSSQDVVGKVAVLNVWASWCPPCETEAPDLKKAAEAIAAAGKPVVFMGINYRDNPDSGRATAGAVGHPVPVARRPGRRDHPGAAGQGHLAARRRWCSTAPGGSPPGSAARSTASTLTGLVDDVLAEQ